MVNSDLRVFNFADLNGEQSASRERRVHLQHYPILLPSLLLSMMGRLWMLCMDRILKQQLYEKAHRD